MFVLRPAELTDLPQIESIAAKSAIGITSLPPDRDRLTDKITNSRYSFASEVDLPGEEAYFFVLENANTGEIVGTSGIAAAAGFHDRFYSYRNEIIVHASQELKVSNKIHALHLCHDLTGLSLLTSFYIDPTFVDSDLPDLLSRARLLYVAEQRQRFADKLAAENPGVCDAEGRSPFWDAVGRRFFNMDYPQAEQLSGGRSKTFIAELMPQYPIYVPLLPAAAKLAIGQLHPDGELPFSILMDEGFEADTYVDIFDGGPTVEARVETLRSVRLQRRMTVSTSLPNLAETIESGRAVMSIVANTKSEGFRATIAPVVIGTGSGVGNGSDHIGVSREVAVLIDVDDGDAVRVVPLDTANHHLTGATW
ncbi:MAG: arginine N-succinyltransferase [Rhodocyclaceae bacterium]|jgi:arginine N-succinyltransferase|nr:arginine N-succinyltransferase [Rhodocyclaceae bacterium]MCE2724438.1 arginine N-succinyltransferase [Betaproteobacteria bacterium]MCA3019279.1 arginine N-succinyltransferase [Rhodocyclaceae bacterium]MCA3022125.1 arginine N-succinyltransferase [Rhodocyclaceae bacterium]MCA3024274.1 arginine N-succinyltransferase [Rhodocyclaceae bacterium]